VTLKNLFLLSAVIGCGIFTTIQKTAKSGQLARAEQVQQVIFVPAKDLFVGTKLEKEKLAEFIKKKWVSKTEVPPNAILNEYQLIGAQVTRNLKADDCFLTSYVTHKLGLLPPPGKHLYTLKLPYECVGPWVQPGREVDVVCTHRPPRSSVVRHVKFLHKIPVQAVDYGPSNACMQMFITVTFEAGIYESHWMQMAKDSGALIRLIIDDGCAKFTKPSDDELYELFKDIAKETKNRQENK
jgi:Flp pilus assembly protein CpaB